MKRSCLQLKNGVFKRVLSASLFSDCLCPVLNSTCGAVTHAYWWKCFRYPSYNYKVCNWDITILLSWPSKNTFGLCLLMISWNCLSSIYPLIICTNCTDLLRCTQRFVVSRSWDNGVTWCPVQNLKSNRHHEINADQMQSRQTKMQSGWTKMQSRRTKMQSKRTKMQSKQTKMRPNTLSLKKEGRRLFLFYLID